MSEKTHKKAVKMTQNCPGKVSEPTRIFFRFFTRNCHPLARFRLGTTMCWEEGFQSHPGNPNITNTFRSGIKPPQAWEGWVRQCQCSADRRTSGAPFPSDPSDNKRIFFYFKNSSMPAIPLQEHSFMAVTYSSREKLWGGLTRSVHILNLRC